MGAKTTAAALRDLVHPEISGEGVPLCRQNRLTVEVVGCRLPGLDPPLAWGRRSSLSIFGRTSQRSKPESRVARWPLPNWAPLACWPWGDVIGPPFELDGAVHPNSAILLAGGALRVCPRVGSPEVGRTGRFLCVGMASPALGSSSSSSSSSSPPLFFPPLPRLAISSASRQRGLPLPFFFVTPSHPPRWELLRRCRLHSFSRLPSRPFYFYPDAIPCDTREIVRGRPFLRSKPLRTSAPLAVAHLLYTVFGAAQQSGALVTKLLTRPCSLK